jgi:hypothetical protein
MGQKPAYNFASATSLDGRRRAVFDNKPALSGRTHDALDHHGRNAGEHGLGQRGG